MDKEKYKKIRKRESIIVTICIMIFIIGVILYSFFSSVTPTKTSSTCEETNIQEVKINGGGYNEVNGKVDDFYVKDKRFSYIYWYKICNYLLKEKLNETLSQNKNLSLWVDYNGGSYSREDNPDNLDSLDCAYRILFGEIYNEAEKGTIIFNKSDIIVQKEKNPPKYNQKLVGINYNGLGITHIYNGNYDYDITIVLKLNQTRHICE